MCPPLLLAFIFEKKRKRREFADAFVGCGAPHKPLPTQALARPLLLPLPST